MVEILAAINAVNMSTILTAINAVPADEVPPSKEPSKPKSRVLTLEAQK